MYHEPYFSVSSSNILLYSLFPSKVKFSLLPSFAHKVISSCLLASSFSNYFHFIHQFKLPLTYENEKDKDDDIFYKVPIHLLNKYNISCVMCLLHDIIRLENYDTRRMKHSNTSTLCHAEICYYTILDVCM